MATYLKQRYSVLYFIFVCVLTACGGGGGSAADPDPITTQPIIGITTAYPVDVVIRNIVTNGYSGTTSVTGTVDSAAASGVGSVNSTAAQLSGLEGSAALRTTFVSSKSLNIGGVSRTESSTDYIFYSSNYAPVSALDTDTGAYSVVTSFAGWPTAALPGDTGILAQSTVYTDVTKRRVKGNQTLRYTIEADSSMTAILLLTTTETNNSAVAVKTQHDRYRITGTGVPTLLSSRTVIANAYTSSDLTETVSTIGAPTAITASPGPVFPHSTGLWAPASGATPSSNNYIYLQSDAGDYIGAGNTYTHTQADSVMSFTANSGSLSVNVNGDANWSGDFQAMSGLSQLRPGYYGDLQRWPFHDASKGGLSWTGNGRGCNTLQGWFVVDSVLYVAGVLKEIDIRFEQHCEGAGPALRGEIHWTANDPTTAPGPVSPAPATLWAPASGSTPATGNYVYLESQAGDYIGQGLVYTHTTMSVSANSGHLGVSAGGWFGDFQAMNSLSQLQVGYYGNLRRYPFHNPMKGGLSWSGNGRGCNTLTGWFVVDSVTYVSGTLTAFELRFEQHCEGGAPALRGKIRWSQ